MSDGNVSERASGAAREVRDGAHFDVLIVGAGISGIGAAWHLQTQATGKTYRIVESQADFGGTWRTHTYPGVRSDSDLHTFGYRFKAWRGPPIATAQEILAYMGEVIDENDIARHIRYRTRVLTADWSETDCRWVVEMEDVDTGERFRHTAGFLWMCQGYFIGSRCLRGAEPTCCWPAERQARHPELAECSHRLIWRSTFGSITRRGSRTNLYASDSDQHLTTAATSILRLLDMSPNIQSSLRRKRARREQIKDRQDASA